MKRWMSQGPLGGLMGACARLFRKGVALLEIPTPEAEQLLRRVTTMERYIILPLKAAGILMLMFGFFNSWIKDAIMELHVDAEEWTRYFLWYYVPANVVIGGVLLALRRLPLGLVQWAVFISGLLDIILLSALTVFTAGYQGFSYWLFLALIVRSAVGVPRATSQLALHGTIIICYVMTGIILTDVASSLEGEARAREDQRERALKYAARSRSLGGEARVKEDPRRAEHLQALRPALRPPARAPISPGPASRPAAQEESSLPLTNRLGSAPVGARPGQSSAPAGNAEHTAPESRWTAIELEGQAEPLLVRLALLVLTASCAYGVQVLIERQRKAEEEAREAALREGQLHAAGRLAAEFAHQIKNPLAVINTTAYSIQRGLKQGRPVNPKQIQIIQEEVERSDRIITDIMGYAQLSEGRVEKLSVTEELDRAIERVFPPAAGYPVVVHRDYGADFPPLLMLRRHASEAFINLLQNAREALDGRGGNVFVRAECRSNYSIEVAIGDDGPGIPSDKREQIFEAYYTTKPKGTGLGLATVKHNVELYGGTVRVESELGKGASFLLIFPAKTLMKLANQVK
ncbi:MAG TPA: ATP-binding protein [Dongiaceae bacterium]|nr:ATP-binding protein [Dongiaceae bacterium]